MTINHQKLPASGEAREALRRKGQFWTPAWVAEAMAAYVLADSPEHVFDPAVGEGAFFRAIQNLTRTQGRRVELLGMEIDAAALEKAHASGLTANDLSQVRVGDFVLSPPSRSFQAIIANPPYMRHHRLGSDTKAVLQKFAADFTGLKIDGRAGLHVYFLMRALQLLAPGGRLAFILPADTAEGKFAPELWRWITGRYCLEAVVTFAPDATPFPGVDTNALVFLIRSAAPRPDFAWAKVCRAATPDFKAWTAARLQNPGTADMDVTARQVAEGLQAGLSRPFVEANAGGWMLGDFASVVRGVATGANEFFLLTRAQAGRGIAASGRVFAACRGPNAGRPIRTCCAPITSPRWTRQAGPRSCCPCPVSPLETFPSAAARSIWNRARRMGLPDKALIQQRRPWYKMEQRGAFRRSCSHIWDAAARASFATRAGAIPLTGFLCVYPHQEDERGAGAVYGQFCSIPESVANLARVGKSYGSREPSRSSRALWKNCRFPEHVLKTIGS